MTPCAILLYLSVEAAERSWGIAGGRPERWGGAESCLFCMAFRCSCQQAEWWEVKYLVKHSIPKWVVFLPRLMYFWAKFANCNSMIGCTCAKKGPNSWAMGSWPGNNSSTIWWNRVAALYSSMMASSLGLCFNLTFLLCSIWHPSRVSDLIIIISSILIITLPSLQAHIPTFLKLRTNIWIKAVHHQGASDWCCVQITQLIPSCLMLGLWQE